MLMCGATAHACVFDATEASGTPLSARNELPLGQLITLHRHTSVPRFQTLRSFRYWFGETPSTRRNMLVKALGLA